MLHIHEQMQHAGTGTVISEVKRQGIWILRSKKTVSSVIRKCRKCSRFLAGPASEQTPPFPRCRVTCRRPFEATGMDLGGPTLRRAARPGLLCSHACQLEPSIWRS